MSEGQVQKEWLTIAEAANYLGVSYAKMSTLVKEGVYPVSKVPGFKNLQRISRRRLDEMLYENEQWNQEKEASSPRS